MKKLPFICIFLLCYLSDTAWATQSHGGPEGLYVHQMAHVFFAFSMGLMIFWLRKRRLAEISGWRFIQYGAILFILWNLDAMISHWIQELSGWIHIQSVSVMQIRIVTKEGYEWLAPFYYITKLDHLLAVPAMIFWFLGFRRLYKVQNDENNLQDGPS